jgi:hypothetical protein
MAFESHVRRASTSPPSPNSPLPQQRRRRRIRTWYASSRVWHSTIACTSPGLGSSCCRIDSTNTAVLPMPDLAWHSTSMPRIACGMHSCWTARAGTAGRTGGRLSEWPERRRAHSAQRKRRPMPRPCYPAPCVRPGPRCGRLAPTFRGVLEAAVRDRLQQLRLEHQLLEAGGVDADVALLLLPGLGARGLILLHLLLLVLRSGRGGARPSPLDRGVGARGWRGPD